jgi:hypothetical protein
MITQSRGGLFKPIDRRAVEKLFGVPLPGGVEDIKYLREQPSADLAFFEACLRFRASHDSYLELISRRDLKLFRETGPTAQLPRNWQQLEVIKPPQWWNPSDETPPDAASATIGVYGCILAKWENEYVYVIISDTGHAAQTP